MHVLVLPSWYPAHPADLFGSFFREQALAIQDSGCSVGVLAPRLVSLTSPLSSIRAAQNVSFENDMGMPTYRKASVNWTPRFWRANAKRIGASGWRLYQLYCRNYGRPDIIHVHSTIMSGVAAKIIWERDGIPFIVSEHSSAYARGQIPSEGIDIARSVIEQASEKFAVSNPFCRILEKSLGLPANSYRAMPNMVDQSFLEQPLSNKKGRQRRLLHISFLDRNKNVQLILQAFCRAFAGDTDFNLTIGGDGPERPSLIALAKSLRIEGQVHFPGKLTRDEVRREMAAADAFLLSSDHETFGIVLIEAMAMGVPVVATCCGGPEDIVTSETGIIVPRNDLPAYTAAMTNVVKERSRWNAEKIRAICVAEYGAKAITARWLKTYQLVVSRPV